MGQEVKSKTRHFTPLSQDWPSSSPSPVPMPVFLPSLCKVRIWPGGQSSEPCYISARFLLQKVPAMPARLIVSHEQLRGSLYPRER